MKLRCIKTLEIKGLTLVRQGQVVEATNIHEIFMFTDTLDGDEWYISKNEFGQYTFDGFAELGPIFEEA